MLDRGGKEALTKTKVYEFLNENKKLIEIRNKLRDPMLSKTHQGNWSKNVFKRFETIVENFDDNGKTMYRKIKKPN